MDDEKSGARLAKKGSAQASDSDVYPMGIIPRKET
jgi:hypothetical protein